MQIDVNDLLRIKDEQLAAANGEAATAKALFYKAMRDNVALQAEIVELKKAANP